MAEKSQMLETRIRKALLDKGLQLQNIYQSIGKSRSYMYEIFRNNDLRLSELKSLGTVLGEEAVHGILMEYFDIEPGDSTALPMPSQVESQLKDKLIRCLEEKDRLHGELRGR